MSNTLFDLMTAIIAFRDERDWKQFHTPQNLAQALSIEIGELQEILLWKSPTEVQSMLTDDGFKERLKEEIGDVLIFSLLFCESANIAPAEAIITKLSKNRLKYPIEKARGRATKYTVLERPQDG